MKPRVLLIEDNETNCYLAKFLLEESGLTVIHAPNGKEGVKRAREELPDLIVMDIEMPEMDGYEAAAAIKQAGETKHIPIVASTSYAMSGDRDRALASGFVEYIEKPYEPDDFVRRIRCHLPVPPP